VTSIGAERVVDYTREDFAKQEARFDVVLDCIGDRTLSDYRRVMNRGGVYVGVGGSGGVVEMLVDLLKVAVVSPFVSQRFVTFIASVNGKDLGALAELMRSGKVTPVIDRSYPLEEAADAVRYLETRHARGKVVVTIR
jgi:NADPH:quinone reductase-like Zn-dependent oxidoreductase